VDALIFAEEAYNCVAIAYNLVHQTSAEILIEVLIEKDDFMNGLIQGGEEM
jgi:hypothetical protein